MFRKMRRYGQQLTQQEAEQILCANGGLVLPDLREGENSAAELYLFIQRKKAEANGEPFAPEHIRVPEALDFRMS